MEECRLITQVQLNSTPIPTHVVVMWRIIMLHLPFFLAPGLSFSILCTPRDSKGKVSVLYNPEVSLFLVSKIHQPSHSQHSLYELKEFRSPGN